MFFYRLDNSSWARCGEVNCVSPPPPNTYAATDDCDVRLWQAEQQTSVLATTSHASIQIYSDASICLLPHVDNINHTLQHIYYLNYMYNTTLQQHTMIWWTWLDRGIHANRRTPNDGRPAPARPSTHVAGQWCLVLIVSPAMFWYPETLCGMLCAVLRSMFYVCETS